LTAYEHPHQKAYKSYFPTLNVHRSDELVATNTIYLNTPVVDSGATIAQVFVAVKSLVMFMPLRLTVTSIYKTKN